MARRSRISWPCPLTISPSRLYVFSVRLDCLCVAESMAQVGAGFLGAGLTLAVAALALGLLFFLGFRAIRKNKTAAASTTGSTGNMVQNDDRSSMTTSMRKA